MRKIEKMEEENMMGWQWIIWVLGWYMVFHVIWCIEPREKSFWDLLSDFAVFMVVWVIGMIKFW